ncbi:hypothetical protein JL721_10064 [Aureococcus anophagefferens]|nr:hypothetical protein JL721_10064 [Aureococcus anophagefferens]
MDDDDDEDPYNFDLAGDDDLGYGDDDSASMSYSPARRAPAARPAPESKKAPASAMLSKKPASYGGGRAEKESTVDDILAGLSSDGDESEASRPRGLTRQTSTLGRGAAPRAGSRSFDLGSLGGSDSNDQSQSFDQGSLDKPRPTISPSPEADRRRLRDETRIGRGLGDMPKLGLARKSVWRRPPLAAGAPDPARSPDPEPAAREGGTRWRELEDAPLTATTKGDLSSSRRGTVRCGPSTTSTTRARRSAPARRRRATASRPSTSGAAATTSTTKTTTTSPATSAAAALEAAAERALLRSPGAGGVGPAAARRRNSSPPREARGAAGKPGAARRTVSFDGDALSSGAAPLHSSGGSPGGALEESLAEDDSDGDRTVGQRDAAGSSDSGENYEGESVADDDDAAPNAPNVRSFSDLAAVAAPESSDGDDDAEEYSDEFGNESPASRSPRSGPEPPRGAAPLGPPAAAGPPPARLATPPSSVAARATAGAVVRSFDDLALAVADEPVLAAAPTPTAAPDPVADAKVDEHTARELRREAKHARAAREAAGRNADLTDSEDNERGDDPPAAAAAKTRRVRSHAGHVFFTVRLGLLAIEHLDGTARDVFVADVAAALGVSRRSVDVVGARESLAGDGSVLEARVAVRGGADARALGAAIARCPRLLVPRAAPDFRMASYVGCVRVRGDDGEVHFDFAEGAAPRAATADAGAPRALAGFARCREVATQFSGNHAGIQADLRPPGLAGTAAYVPLLAAAAHEAAPALPFDASAAPPRSPTFLIDNAASLAHADDATLANIARAYIAQASAARDARRGAPRPPPPGPLFGSYPPPPPTFAAYRPPPAPLPAPAPPPDVVKTPRKRAWPRRRKRAGAAAERASRRRARASGARAAPTPPRPPTPAARRRGAAAARALRLRPLRAAAAAAALRLRLRAPALGYHPYGPPPPYGYAPYGYAPPYDARGPGGPEPPARGRAKLAERATYDAARARPPSTEAHHTLAATQEYIDTHRPAPLPYWKAYMSVGASLTEEEARQLAFDDVKHKRGAAAPVSAVAATTASAAAGPDGPDGGVGEAKEG